ncbi:uncharacterized protein LOC129984061 isoform X2 [Argiope bruennichi]|uniref:uncharacterized protein LOC129984061 isoform X2 n=1 Tax=Argiope bruennichi TaxID=94029 RepID=UPI00249574AA|nr:uncharacterized protein LOC129984061 isoform X2 [Argiope bruennichi]
MLRFFIITEKTLRFSYYLIFLFTFIKDAYSQPYKSLHFNRSVLLSGYHRILQYNITLPEVRGPTQILIMDTLPKDAYIDPYQLCKRIEDNEFKLLTNEQIHSEIPAYQAQSFRIQLCSVSQTNSHEIEVPIHLRYQKPHDCKIYGKSVIINLADAVVHIRTLSKGNS